MPTPLISVLMPVKNMERYIGEALRSLLAQSVDDMEVIVIGDGCTDQSLRIARELEDPRIKILTLGRSQRNRIHLALNEGLALATGTYVARQDADDVSLPFRLERQIEVLADDARCAAVGTAAEVIDSEGRSMHFIYPPRTDGGIRRRIEAQTPFIHGTVMMRRSVLEAVGGYRPFYRSQDFDLWLRLLERFRMANLGEILYRYRVHGQGVSRMVLHRRHHYRRLAWELSLQRRAGHREDRQAALLAMRSDARAILLEAERDYRAQLGNVLLMRGRPLAALREYLRAIACFPLRWRSYVSAVAALLGTRGSRVVRHAITSPSVKQLAGGLAGARHR